jgi:succinate dehydrogenase hydrophobic anchor subunit
MNLQYIRHSFSARLSLWVTGLVTAIFVVALTVFFRFTMSVDTDESLEKIMQMLENTALQADHELLQTELTAKTTRWHRRGQV